MSAPRTAAKADVQPRPLLIPLLLLAISLVGYVGLFLAEAFGVKAVFFALASAPLAYGGYVYTRRRGG